MISARNDYRLIDRFSDRVLTSVPLTAISQYYSIILNALKIGINGEIVGQKRSRCDLIGERSIGSIVRHFDSIWYLFFIYKIFAKKNIFEFWSLHRIPYSKTFFRIDVNISLGFALCVSPIRTDVQLFVYNTYWLCT